MSPSEENVPGMEVALHRYDVISPLISGSYQGKKEVFYRDQSEKSFKNPEGQYQSYSAATIKKWYLMYTKDGINALLPNVRADAGRSRKLTPEIKAKIREYRQRFERITGQKIWENLMEDGITVPNQISVDTVQRYLRTLPLPPPRHENDGEKEMLSFEHPHVNDCWQCDTLYGPEINYRGKVLKRLHHISFLDDHSRWFTNAHLILQENRWDVLKILKDAIRICGKPRKIMFDHGSPYDNNDVRWICGDLGIEYAYCRVRKPEGKGKEERSHRTCLMRSYDCTDYLKCTTVEEADAMLQEYIRTDYAKKVNRMTHQTPEARFMAEYPDLTFVPQETLDNVFLMRHKAKADATCRIFFQNLSWQLPSETQYKNKWVWVRYNPEKPDELYVVDKKTQKLLHTVKPISEADLHANASGERKPLKDSDRADPDEETCSAPDTETDVDTDVETSAEPAMEPGTEDDTAPMPEPCIDYSKLLAMSEDDL